MHIQLRQLTKTFGQLKANDAITVSFAAGQVHGILGENGAGKSTLMKVLAGVLVRDAGEILLDGRPVLLGTPAAALKAGIGMLYQDPMDIPAFRVLENIVCASPRGTFPTMAAARRRLHELADQLALPIDPEAPIASLTVGQRQQVELLRLLAWGMRVLILDEPTTGITAMQRQALFSALRILAARGHTILFVSHKLEEILTLCDTATVLRAGRVMGEGAMALPQTPEYLLSLMFEHGEQDSTSALSPSPTCWPAHDTGGASLTPPVWQLQHVRIREGALVLSDLNLSIAAGRIVGLAGLVGSGQQLLLRLLAGLCTPERGRLLLFGREQPHPQVHTFLRAGIVFLPADRLGEGIIGPLSLTEHLILQRQATRGPTSWATVRQEALAAIETYDIRGTPDTPLAQLSGGNQQRAMFALIPPDSKGLLLEQPTRGLDRVSARAIWTRLLERCAHGAALVFASTDLDELLTYSHDILVFFGGKVTPPIPRTALTAERLASLIGGVGFDELLEDTVRPA